MGWYYIYLIYIVFIYGLPAVGSFSTGYSNLIKTVFYCKNVRPDLFIESPEMFVESPEMFEESAEMFLESLKMSVESPECS